MHDPPTLEGMEAWVERNYARDREGGTPYIKKAQTHRLLDAGDPPATGAVGGSPHLSEDGDPAKHRDAIADHRSPTVGPLRRARQVAGMTQNSLHKEVAGEWDL